MVCCSPVVRRTDKSSSFGEGVIESTCSMSSSVVFFIALTTTISYSPCSDRSFMAFAISYLFYNLLTLVPHTISTFLIIHSFFLMLSLPTFIMSNRIPIKNKKQAEYSDLFYHLTYHKWKHSIIHRNNDRSHTFNMQSNEIPSANRTPFRQSPL